MKTRLIALVAATVMLFGTMPVFAQGASGKFCKNFTDYASNHWTPISSLGGSKCELKFSDNEFKFKTGNKDADKHLRKETLVVHYSGHYYVNCRNLDCDKFSLDCANYAQAYRYGNGKLLLVAYHISDGAFLASLAGDIVGIAVPGVVGKASSLASDVIWFGSKDMKGFRCYLLDSTDEEGEGKVKGLDDDFMENLLKGNASLLSRYKTPEKKSDRLSAFNILPILREKGLIHE